MATGTVILQCLTGYIGLISCDETTPGSELYINDLPGISSEVIQVITKPSDETFVATWEDIEKRGILMFRSQLMAELNKCYEVHKMDTVECLACENAELLSVALWYLLGHLVMVQALINWNVTHFTTVDRTSVEEIRDYYFNQFQVELNAAVKGIDVENSICAEDKCITQNGTYHFRDSLM